MTITLEMHPAELSTALLDKIRGLLTGNKVVITISSPEQDETAYLMQDEVLMQRVAEVKAGTASLVTLESAGVDAFFQEIASRAEARHS